MTIVFDVDGTLLDSQQRYYQAHCGALRSGRSPLSSEAYWQLKRTKVSEASILQQCGLKDHPEEYEERRVQLLEMPALLSLDTPLAGVVETLAILKQSHRLVVVSLRREADRLPVQLAQFFPNVFDLVVANPPEPTPWDAKAASIRTRVADAQWIVGDTEADVRGGRLAGIRVCAVTTGIRTRECLELMSPDAVIDSLRELPSILHSSSELELVESKRLVILEHELALRRESENRK